MKKLIYISIIATFSTLWSCTKFDETSIEADTLPTITNVEILEDGQMRVTGKLGTSTFGEVSVSSRATVEGEEDIDRAWFLIFGEDAAYRAIDDVMYTDDSPLLLCTEVETITTDGVFYATFPQYKGVAFMRIVANLTTREIESLESVAAWGDDDDNYYYEPDANYTDGIKTLLIPGTKYENDEVVDNEDFDDATTMAAYGTFGQYRYQSVGLDGIYSNASSASYTTNTTTSTATATGDEGVVTTSSTTTDNGVATTTITTITTVGDTATTTITTITYASHAEVAPDPSSFTSKIPMSSVGFVLNDGITVETISEFLGTTVYMVRACSKATVTVSDADFTLNKVYMIDCAQESTIRSTVLTSDSDAGTEASTIISVPEDLGGTIDYEPLVETVIVNGETSPIYFYPNAGGDYYSNSEAVNNGTNPQYVIIKGKSANYDTDGYYKIALKAQYAMSYEYDDNDYSLLVDDDGNYIVKEWSDVTYDILRNTHFKINLLTVDKPGYKTLADAKNENNPASNISYSITILGTDGRNEILVSNGTYFVELNTTRVYMAGYGDDGNAGSISFTITPNQSNAAYTHPAAYVQADYGVSIESCLVDGGSLLEIDLSDDEIVKALFEDNPASTDYIDGYYDAEIASAYEDWEDFQETFYDTADQDDDVKDIWYKVPSSSSTSVVDVNYRADYSGRVRLRIGDMLKFIPVFYEDDMIHYTSDNMLSIGEVDSFAWDKIEFLSLGDSTADDFTLFDVEDTSDSDYSWFSYTGEVAQNKTGDIRELRAMIYPTNADGITKVYFKQASTSVITNPDERTEGDAEILKDGNVIFLDKASDYEYKDASGETVAKEEAIAETVVDMFEEGYTTVYFDDSATNADIGDILDNVTENIEDAIENGDLDSDFTYTLDMSTMGGVYLDFGAEGKEGYDYFQDNPYVYKIVLPGDGLKKLQKLDGGVFYNCPNLTILIVGTPANPAPEFDTIESGVFVSCPKLETIIVYSGKGDTPSVSLTSGTAFTSNALTDNSSLYYYNGSNYIEQATGSDHGKLYLWGVKPADYTTPYVDNSVTTDDGYTIYNTYAEGDS